MSLVVKPGCIGAAAPVLFNCIKRSRKLRSGVACVVGGSACGLRDREVWYRRPRPIRVWDCISGHLDLVVRRKESLRRADASCDCNHQADSHSRSHFYPRCGNTLVRVSPPSFPNKGRAHHRLTKGRRVCGCFFRRRLPCAAAQPLGLRASEPSIA